MAKKEPGGLREGFLVILRKDSCRATHPMVSLNQGPGISKTWPLARLRGIKEGGVVWEGLELSSASNSRPAAS